MNQRFLSVLAFAFTVATLASFLLYRVVTARAGSSEQKVETTKVAVASRTLELGRVIKDEDIRMGDWAGALPAGAITRKEELVGRGVISAVYENEPLVASRLAPKGAGGGLAPMIPHGMRAVAVRVNEIVGVAGFVVPGMRVDVLVSGNSPGGNSGQGTITRTLLQNIEVLSAGQDFRKDAEGKPVSVQVVNLLVNPEQAELLSLASNQTTIQLVLRNPLDHELSTPPGTALAQLLDGEYGRPAKAVAPAARRAPRPAVVRPAAPPAPETAAPVQPLMVEVLQGTKRVELKFENKPEEW